MSSTPSSRRSARPRRKLSSFSPCGPVALSAFEAEDVRREAAVTAIAGRDLSLMPLAGVSGGDRGPPPHVERDGSKQDLPACLGETDVANAGEPHPAFEGRKGGLHRCSSSCDEEIVAFEPWRQFRVMPVGAT